MADMDRCHEVLDEFFQAGVFGGHPSPSAVARFLRVAYPEFRLTKRGAESVVKVWMDCARELGEID